MNEPVYTKVAYPNPMEMHMFTFVKQIIQDCINISKVIDYVELSYHVKIFISKRIHIDTFMYIVV